MISTHFRTSPARPARARRALARVARGGFSLIEVAIALVIFVIGALAIIRIFPGALSVIGNNGNQQIAANLNRSTLASLQSDHMTYVAGPGVTPTPIGVASKTVFNAVPDANFNNSNLNGTLNISTWTTNPSLDHSLDFKDTNSSVIGVPRFNNTLPDTTDIETNGGQASLSRYRVIIGEKARIVELKTYGSNTNQLFALSQFPISVQQQNNSLLPINPTVSQEFLLNDVRTMPDGTLDFSRCRFEDNDNIATTLTVNRGSMLYVSYRYYKGNGTIWGVREESIPITDGSNAQTINLIATNLKVKPPTDAARPDAARTNNGVVTDAIVPEIVEVKYRNYLGQGEFGDPAAPGDNVKKVADARRGLVRLPTAPLVPTKPVILDYCADWSFLLSDGVPSIPTSAVYPALPLIPTTLTYRQLALGAPYIEDQADASLYSVLIEDDRTYLSGYGTAAPNPLVADRMVRATDAANPQQREEELRLGKVTFIVDKAVPLLRARVAYQTRDNWKQQLSVAARSYKPFVNGNTEFWRDYGLGTDGFLYFHAGEAGKTLGVSYTIADGVDGAGNVIVRNFVDRPFVIESAIISAGGLVPTTFIRSFAGPTSEAPQIARVRLTNAAGGNLNPNDLISIQAVRGTSITSRTAYINGTKYAQKLDTTTRGAN